MRRLAAHLLPLGLALAWAAVAAPAGAETKGGTEGVTDNASRKTNCRSAGGTVSETSGSSFTCTLHGDTGTASVSCSEGRRCSCTGSACDEFGGADAVESRAPGSDKGSSVLKMQLAPQTQWKAVQQGTGPGIIEGAVVRGNLIELEPGYGADVRAEAKTSILKPKPGGGGPSVGGKFNCTCEDPKKECVLKVETSSMTCAPKDLFGCASCVFVTGPGGGVVAPQ